MAYVGNNLKIITTTYTPQSADPTNVVDGMIQLADGTVRTEGLWRYDASGAAWIQVGSTAGLVAPITKTTTYTATTADETILAETGTGAWTLTLYAASGNAGRQIRVKKTDSDNALLTIDANGSETIDGALTYIIADENEFVVLECDGTNWNVIAKDIGKGSTITLNTGNGFGSTNNKIRIFSTIVVNNQGSIDYTTSAAAGSAFEIQTDGVYSVSYSDRGGELGLSLNSTELTTQIRSITPADRLAFSGTITDSHNIAWTGALSAGDIIRPHNDSGQTDADYNHFTITRVG